MASSLKSKTNKPRKRSKQSKKLKKPHPTDSFDSETFDAEADEMKEDLVDEISECNVNDSPTRHMPHTGRMRVKLHGQDAATWDDGMGENSPEETKPTLLNTLQAPINRNFQSQK